MRGGAPRTTSPDRSTLELIVRALVVKRAWILGRPKGEDRGVWQCVPQVFVEPSTTTVSWRSGRYRRPEGHLDVLAGPDNEGGTARHLAPDPGQVAERLGNDHARLVREY
jgi:hypothetical protein